MAVCAPVLVATFAHAQQFDFAVGGSSPFSTKNITDSLAYPAPAERGGVYPGISLDRVFENHFGYNAEIAYRYDKGVYNNYQQFRPVMYDFNVLFEPRMKGFFPARFEKRMAVDFLAGAGGQSVIFYSPVGTCACSTHLNSNHFLLHAGVELRYRLWRNFFVRPEAHLYRILNNTSDFHSDNVLRLGASVGYTFHTD